MWWTSFCFLSHNSLFRSHFLEFSEIVLDFVVIFWISWGLFLDFSVKFLSLWRGLWWWASFCFLSHNSLFHSVGLPITLLTYHCHCPPLWISIEGPLCSAATDIVRDKQITLLPYLIIMSSILPLTRTFVTLYRNVFECSLSGGHE